MPEKDYKIYLNDIIRICVYFLSKGKDIEKFVVKLEFYYSNKWIEIERYDCYHNHIHKDILDRKGNKKRIVNYGISDIKTGLNFAIMDFKENHNLYIWRFINDKK